MVGKSTEETVGERHFSVRSLARICIGLSPILIANAYAVIVKERHSSLLLNSLKCTFVWVLFPVVLTFHNSLDRAGVTRKAERTDQYVLTLESMASSLIPRVANQLAQVRLGAFGTHSLAVFRPCKYLVRHG